MLGPFWMSSEGASAIVYMMMAKSTIFRTKVVYDDTVLANQRFCHMNHVDHKVVATTVPLYYTIGA
jgi:hypothetical protein